MNKQDNKLALSVLAALTAGIALIYTLIMYHTVIYAVAGVSVLFLITAYILTHNIITFITMRNKSMNVQIKGMVDDLSAQLENMSSTQAQIGKATYLFTRQTAKAVTILEGNYTESQEALYRNLTVLSNTQNKATKLLIKYDLDNTRKLISTLKEIRNHLSETMSQGFDQITPNNDEVIATLQTIVDYLNSQSNEMDQTMGLQLDKVARELQNISNNIQKVQFSAQNMAPVMPVAPQQPIQTAEPPVMETVPVEEPLAMEDIPTEEPLAMEDIPTEEPLAMEDIPAEEPLATEDIPAEEPLAMEDVPAEEPLTMEDIPTEEPLAMEDIPTEEPDMEPAADTPEADNTPENEESFTPTFTVVGKEAEAQAAEPAEEPVAAPALDGDPNKQLSADEIAALFAASDPAPKREKPAEKPAATDIDPNKQLSADEIAALFAASDPAPKAEAPAAEEPKTEPANVAPVTSDPNKQLSADEIAALFAQMG
ncbi:MAG: hypothetical protein NC347_12105 [Clostridium sp.]|nr:hypothetical protein [Clostridium sp.]